MQRGKGKQRPDRRPGKLWVIGLGFIWLLGCTYPSALKQDYGQSVNHNQMRQVVNPRAGWEDRPVVGLSPEAAKKVMERYNNSFCEKEEKAPTVIQLLGQ